MIAGFEHRWQVEDHIAALEREKTAGHMNPVRVQKIEEQQAIFRAELERMDREGDYEEPERPVRRGPFAWVGEYGAPQYR